MPKFVLAKSEKEKIIFGQALYQSFKDLKSSWLMKNYIFDEQTKSLKPSDPNCIYRPFYERDTDGIICGYALNLNHSAEFQLEKMGFTIPGGRTAEMCEVTSFFILQRKNPLRSALGSKKIYTFLEQLGFTTGWSTAHIGVLKLYQYIGWRIVDEKKINGKTIWLLTFDRKSAEDILPV
ncbi:MAG: hypothetical protein COB67_09385 [SAR324 cluster bacterium]|uniref:Acyl-homoserine-lactone synthase n=1 Tax=SAR324 cluster bacterium TaxID=2024889 RepID=A0A2A4T199_9DELT|nr:MAG: hypothetical protein COB67_09385 [SAR324 cluster bacterium]